MASSGRRIGGGLVLSLAALASCVPATEELAPRGAAGVVLEPSPAARGEPLLTSDGWTLRFEALAIVAWVGAVSVTGGEAGSSSFVMWNGAHRAESIVRALLVSSYAVDVRLGSLLFDPTEAEAPDVVALSRAHGVAADLATRFLRRPDNATSSVSSSDTSAARLEAGPALVFVLRAEKGDQVRVLDLALAPGDLSLDRGVEVAVRANDVVFVQMQVAPERLFQTASGATLPFQPIADADRDGDGRVSVPELREERDVDDVPCRGDSSVTGGPRARAPGVSDRAGQVDTDCPTLLQGLAVRAAKIIRPR